MSKRDVLTIRVVYKKSAYDIYIQKYRDPRMTELVENDDTSIQWMLEAHRENQDALEHVRSVLKERGIRARWSYRAKPRPLNEVDLVLAVGGDGTLLEAARMIMDDTPILGMRSTPSQSVGFLCAGDASQCGVLLDRYIQNHLPIIEVSRIEVEHNGERLFPYALNDVLFAHGTPAATSRYTITWKRDGQIIHSEKQRSSGVWVASATGSTAAIHSAGGEAMSLSDKRLQFSVRELYQGVQDVPSACSGGFLGDHDTLEIRSHMRRAFLFFDGPWQKRVIQFGDTLVFRKATQPLRIAEPLHCDTVGCKDSDTI